MRWYKADLHIHSVLSPCGDLSMSPQTVMKKANEKELDLIAITDHNSMLNCTTYEQVAKQYGLNFLCGMEIQTAEEIHLVTLFDDFETGKEFGELIYISLLPVANDPEHFGDQVIIDEKNNIIKFEEKALINSSILPLDEIVKLANSYNAFVFPAHVDAESFSIISQLGLIPDYLEFDACGITAKGNRKDILAKFPQLKEYQLIRNSDAHYPDDIGSGATLFYLDVPTISELKKACRFEHGRKISIKKEK